MEFYKKEKNIKEILERRKIQPSDELWVRLEQEMDDKNKFSYSTLRIIAAVLVIVLSIGGIFYFNSAEVIPDEIVNEDSSSKSLKEENEKTKIIPSINFEKTEKETELKPEKNIVISENDSPRKSLNESSGKSTEYSKIIDSKEKFENEKAIVVNVDKEEEILFENTKIDQVLDSIEMELSLEEETLKLLAEAAENKASQDESKLDAEALLTEVDREISEESDINLRDKMHDMLKESWDKAKSALALNK